MSVFRTGLEKAESFLTTPESPEPLGFFRIAMAAFALLQAFLWFPDWMAFFGREGWIQWEISRALNLDWHIHLQLIADQTARLGMTADQTVKAFWWVYVLSLSGLLLGWYTRVFAVLSWCCHYIIMSTIPTFVYGVDIFLQIALFYMMVMPVGKAWSLDVIQGRVSSTPGWGVTLSLRVLQIHLCMAYLSAGYEKMLSPEWWDGNVLWRSLVQPEFRQFDLTWLALYPLIPRLLSWFTMIVETFYCIGMWIPRLRVLWLMAIVSLHLGIGLFLGLVLFGWVMILLSVSAFGYLALRDFRLWRRNRSASSLGQM
jgi:hypothetical protein